MADYGIKISQPGFDVKTCEDKDLIMTSKLNLLKTMATGIASIPVPHGLPYTPIFFSINQSVGAGKYSLIGTDGSYMDDTNFNPNGSTKTYYIFYQQAI